MPEYPSSHGAAAARLAPMPGDVEAVVTRPES